MRQFKNIVDCGVENGLRL